MKPNIKFSAKKHDADIILYGDIGFDITAREFSDQLKALGEVKEIAVRINSFGGDVFEAVAIYSRLVDSGAHIIVYIDGIAASGASVIAMAGHEIHIAEAAFLMIHDAWVMTVGNASKLRQKADKLEAISEQIAGIYQRRSGKDMAEIRALMAAETEFNAEQAVEFGFATEIFEAERLAAKYDPERHHFENAPSVTFPERAAKAQRMIAEMRMQIVR